MLKHFSSHRGRDGYLHEAVTRVFVLISPNFTVLLSANGDLGEVYLMLAGVDVTCEVFLKNYSSTNHSPPLQQRPI